MYNITSKEIACGCLQNTSFEYQCKIIFPLIRKVKRILSIYRKDNQKSPLMQIDIRDFGFITQIVYYTVI